MIKVENLSKSFGPKVAVDNVSFHVRRGEVLGFIGPNGAGKSTTMRIITGFFPSSEGAVFIDGVNMAESPLAAKAKIGYLPESAPLYTNKTVYEFLSFAADIRGFKGEEKQSRINDAVAKCFLEPVLHQSIDTLSKGYKHRTCFAQAILHDPDVLILDEPTDGLDPNQKREVRNLIKAMGKTKAIIISTHILEEVEAVASKVVLISAGKKVFEGTSAELKAKSDKAGTVTLTINGVDSELARATLSNLASVNGVEIAGGEVFSITPKDNSIHTSREVLDCATQKGWSVEEFSIDKGRLDEVFHKLTICDGEVI